MRNISKLTALGAALALSASFAYADTIELASASSTSGPLTATAGDSVNGVTWYNGDNLVTTFVPGSDQTTPASNQTPSSLANAATYTLNANGVWANPLTSPLTSQWVGFATTAGPGGSANPAQGFYTFTTSFTASGGTYNGSLTLMSDDTVEVILDYGTAYQDILNGFSALGYDSTCADNAPSCTVPFTDTLSSVALNNGVNTLTFIVQQAGNVSSPAGQDPSGLDYDGILSQTPEPSSLLLLGSGLISAAGMMFRRRKVVA